MPSLQKIAPLVRKMARRDTLSALEREVLSGLLGPERAVAAGTVLIAPGDRPSFSTFLVSGFCARFSVTAAGGRQLTEINVAGDFIDLHSLLMRQMDHGVVALADCVVAFAPHADLRRLTEQHPHLGRLLWLETVIDGAIHRQWLVTMGQQSAASRLAHLVCELYRRLEAAGLASDGQLKIPMTQTDLGDVLGLTPIHVNRVLMELRREGLIEWKGTQVTIPDWDRLATFAEFDPNYLRLQSDAV
ncbi:Crp/Fnr family transcriptional regulator [Caulobacter segnis]|uniref:Transcriptional regulator, Crp/Fnr family n=2 Tax=Caulobacter segnis TaxID=88688 RepID=D5VMJ3_CAUST|nr:Crp/Fnr family transcriptional regulator [Caulobacter segnis]ADG11716.1 transcriptional regulator, Crp/Fnr family [Caulobacter segnis ATCC 21756]